MSKTKPSTPRARAKRAVVCCEHHQFSESETVGLRRQLLAWYGRAARTLPWRQRAKEEKGDNVRGYSVLVSEMMLQQTQVSTVVDYYTRWMLRWPTSAALSCATLEEVNQVWSGLGYYSRGRRLWESAKLIESEKNGVMPRTADGLMKLPGVGRYTASAVASIAYGQPVGLVDGNVLRVMSRLRAIGAEIDTPLVTDWIWRLAEATVDPTCPGEFNQAVMELGATVCTPKSPNCGACPVRELCRARQMTVESVPDIEDCQLCLKVKYDPDQGVQNFPRKSRKAGSREQTTLVLALSKVEGGEEVIAVQQRPDTGLLASLWELLSIQVEEGLEPPAQTQAVQSYLVERGLVHKDLVSRGVVSHIFSHISMKYVVYTARLVGGEHTAHLVGGAHTARLQFLTKEEFLGKGTSTAMKKVVQFLQDGQVSAKRKRKPETVDAKQRTISSFFKPKTV